MELKDFFNKYAGKEIAVTEKPWSYKRKFDNFEVSGVHLDYDINDPVIVDLKSDAAKLGLSVRITTPGEAVTMNWRPDRLNVKIDKNPDSGNTASSRSFA